MTSACFSVLTRDNEEQIGETNSKYEEHFKDTLNIFPCKPRANFMEQQLLANSYLSFPNKPVLKREMRMHRQNNNKQRQLCISQSSFDF